MTAYNTTILGRDCTALGSVTSPAEADWTWTVTLAAEGGRTLGRFATYDGAVSAIREHCEPSQRTLQARRADAAKRRRAQERSADVERLRSEGAQILMLTLSQVADALVHIGQSDTP